MPRFHRYGVTRLFKSLRSPLAPPATEALTNQLILLALVNVLTVIVVKIVTSTDHLPKRLRGIIPTHTFFYPAYGIVLGTVAICAFPTVKNVVKAGVNEKLRDKPKSSQPDVIDKWWEANQWWFLLGGVFLGSAAMVFALDRLVHATGGGLHSPFMPLLEAPAVFGPFIAVDWPGVVASVVAVSIAMALEVMVKAPAVADGAYGRGAHAAVIVVVVLIGGVLSVAQKISRKRAAREAQAGNDDETDQALEPEGPLGA